MRVIMPVIIDQAGRQFNVEEADGINRRHTKPLSVAIAQTGPRRFECWSWSTADTVGIPAPIVIFIAVMQRYLDLRMADARNPDSALYGRIAQRLAAWSIFGFGTSSKRASWARWSESLKPSTGSRSVRSTRTGVISTSPRAE
jgi:hypothetical protein